jgi:hypothetical protein
MTKTERMTEAEAITAWNTRPTDERIAEGLTVEAELRKQQRGLHSRIAELETALRQIANRQFHCQHCTASINMRHIARAALKEQP